jgi:hypothetical protein
MYLIGVYFLSVHLTRRIPLRHAPHGYAPRWACTSFTSLPSAHDLGGENPYIDTKDVLKLLNCGRLGRQATGHP